MSFADYVTCNVYPTLVFNQATSTKTKASNDFTIMPNPVSNMLEILNHNQELNVIYDLSIYDMLGKQVYIGKLTGYITRIDVTKWSLGIYTSIISLDGKMKSNGKFIKID